MSSETSRQITLIYCLSGLLLTNQLLYGMEQDSQSRDMAYPAKSVPETSRTATFQFSTELMNAFEDRHSPAPMYVIRLLKEYKKINMPWASKPHYFFDIKSHSIMAKPTDQQKIKRDDDSYRTPRDMRNTYITPRNFLLLFNGIIRGSTLQSCPPQHEFYINKKWHTCGHAILVAALHFKDMEKRNWIRFSGNENSEIYYNSRHFDARSHFYIAYKYSSHLLHSECGIRFREFAKTAKQPEGCFFECYQFDKDPASQDEPMKSLMQSYRKIIEERNTERALNHK